jgi:hypothetical protein
MDDPSSYNVMVWDSKRPDHPTRTRQTNHQLMTNPGVAQEPIPSSNTSMSSNSYTTAVMDPFANPNLQPALANELAQFSTCEIAEELVKIGLTHNAKVSLVQRGGFIPDIQMLSPSLNDPVGQTRRICGPAYTVK